MRYRTVYYLLFVLGILALLADSTPCIKNTASPNEGKNKKKKKGGKDKRCIRQDAWHHEVHYHVLPEDVNWEELDVDDIKGKIYKLKQDQRKADEKKSKTTGKEDNHHEDGPDFETKVPGSTPGYLDKFEKINGRPRTDLPTWTPHKAWTKFGGKAKREASPADTYKSLSVSSAKQTRQSRPVVSRAGGQVYGPPYPFNMDEVEAMKKVNVTIEQNGKDPIAINVIVRNNSNMNITIMTRNSVVDKDAFKLGHFKVYPDDTKINFAPEREEYEWYHRPMGKLGRPSDPRLEYLESDLTHLRPNETVKQTIIVPSGSPEENEQWLKMMQNAKKIKMYVEGKWFAMGAWTNERRWSRHVDFGFKSNTIELEILR
ncbi:hypothetical protein FLONG3_1962 [Fusarium longipes]|uniref:Uncharacterized protein n=1 Tax=Fusarium longipes TaxID=694270 RepID=A0A395T5E2_9HYPO|nr:hypothetical protein FLONG3_1962 [Fusarium longipes]